uniref:Uncharacterized protein n=1 Tax=Triticum urartu TaxID=4572 RepID=A0A8R7QTZ4_TRIUA
SNLPLINNYAKVSFLSRRSAVLACRANKNTLSRGFLHAAFLGTAFAPLPVPDLVLELKLGHLFLLHLQSLLHASHHLFKALLVPVHRGQHFLDGPFNQDSTNHSVAPPHGVQGLYGAKHKRVLTDFHFQLRDLGVELVHFSAHVCISVCNHLLVCGFAPCPAYHFPCDALTTNK